MRAIRFDRFGGPEELYLADVPDPSAGPGDILIEVRAASVIPGDWKLRKGLLTGMFPVTLPKIPGRDGAGIVRETGAGVEGFSVGDRVCFTCQHVEPGSYAEFVCRPRHEVVKLPDNLDFAGGAALMHAGVCAHIAVVGTAGVKRGDRVLIHGAAGAIGGMAVQICRHLGAEVAATCRAANADHVAALGADRVIAYDEEDFAGVLSAQDAVVDLVGGDTHARSYGVLRPGGVLVWLIAAPFEDRSAEHGVDLRQAMIVDDAATLAAVVDLAANGHIRPLVSRTLPLDRAAEAHRILEAGENSRGRLVLLPQEGTE
tara:strand:- start:149 stop:1093 length:945 start_codon:yes stop_codon:yes gene_type:complete